MQQAYKNTSDLNRPSALQKLKLNARDRQVYSNWKRKCQLWMWSCMLGYRETLWNDVVWRRKSFQRTELVYLTLITRSDRDFFFVTCCLNYFLSRLGVFDGSSASSTYNTPLLEIGLPIERFSALSSACTLWCFADCRPTWPEGVLHYFCEVAVYTQ